MTATQPGPLGVFEAVRGVSFDLGRERLGVVGESGSGKSMTGRAILGLVRPPGKVTASRMEFEGKSILNLPERQMRAVRGRRISMVMQDPKFSLNPVMRVGDQIVEAYRQQTGAGRAAARQRAQDGGLARAGFAHQPEAFAPRDGQVDALDRIHPVGRVAEPYPQVADLEDRRAHRTPPGNASIIEASTSAGSSGPSFQSGRRSSTANRSRGASSRGRLFSSPRV